MDEYKKMPGEMAEMRSKTSKTSQTSETSEVMTSKKHGTMPADSKKPNTQVCRKATPLEDWWDSADLKNRFNFSDRTLCTMREKGLLPYTIVGGRCFYRAGDIRKLFDESFYRLNPKLAEQEAQTVNCPKQDTKSYSQSANDSKPSIYFKNDKENEDSRY